VSHSHNKWTDEYYTTREREREREEREAHVAYRARPAGT
jgi:hypothetical protein